MGIPPPAKAAGFLPIKAMSDPAMEAASCPHQFVFLRQEKRNIGYDRNPRYLYEDVFFCEHCLQYQRVKIKETELRRDSFGEVVVG